MMVSSDSDLEARFDRVFIDDDSGRRELSQGEFLRLPLSQRIRCVIERTATFFDGAREVDRHAAINGLRRSQAKG